MAEQPGMVSGNNIDWHDLVDPSEEELSEMAQKYGLHRQLVNDCLQPDHLPKYEKMDNYSFVIFRIYGDNGSMEADTVQQLTNKIAIFCSPEFIITIHRERNESLEQLKESIQLENCNSTAELLNIIVYACLKTYREPLQKLSKKVDQYEGVVFLRAKKIQSLKGLYYLKRKIDLIRRMLILSYEIIDEIDPDGGNVDTRETRDEYVKLQHMFDSLSDNIQQLLTVYFSASSQRTNEIMRVLTLFSVFFMPLTFIVGIYGMNFDYMPEIGWKGGYPAVMVFMVAITIATYFYFKKKDWL